MNFFTKEESRKLKIIFFYKDVNGMNAFRREKSSDDIKQATNGGHITVAIFLMKHCKCVDEIQMVSEIFRIFYYVSDIRVKDGGGNIKDNYLWDGNLSLLILPFL
jgi:hypothetical protein